MQIDGTTKSQDEHRRVCNFFRERRQHTQTQSGNNDDEESITGTDGNLSVIELFMLDSSPSM